MKALQALNSTSTSESTNPSLRLGHLRVDHSHVDCALVLGQYPGGCLLEIDHRSEMTVCFVEDLSDVVILAFDDELEDYRVVTTNTLPKDQLFVGFDEPYLLLLPELVYRGVEDQLSTLNKSPQLEDEADETDFG